MPFPLGILAIQHQPRGAIAWAWGMNGLFTVIGGLASVVIGLEKGFNFAIVVALVLYGLACAVYTRMRDTVTSAAAVAETPASAEEVPLSPQAPRTRRRPEPSPAASP
jgi:hypothetical protein